MSLRIAFSLCFIACLWTIRFLPIAVAQSAEAPAGAKILRVRVVDASGAPVEGAMVSRNVVTEQQDIARYEKFATSVDGFADVTIPQTMRILRLWVRKDGYVELFASWSAPAVDNVPQELWAVMPRATTIGGVVVNPDGEAVSDARVEVRIDGGGTQLNTEMPFKYITALASGDAAARTNDQGRWTLTNVPPGDDLEFLLGIGHPQFVQEEYFGQRGVENGVTTKQLRDRTARVVMQRGEVVRGRVVDGDGSPVPSAAISWSRQDRWAVGDRIVVADKDGRYELPPLGTGTLYLAVAAANQKPQIREVEVVAEMAPVDVVMEPGRELRLTVVDCDGSPIPDVQVIIVQWRGVSSGNRHVQLKLFDGTGPEGTCKDGVFVWTSAPDEAVGLRLRKKGWSDSETELAASNGTHEMTLDRAVVISGAIVDDKTGEPVGPVMMMPVSHYPQRPDDPIVQRTQIQVVDDGCYSYTKTGWDSGIELVLQFEASGYRPKRIGPFNSSSGAASVTVRLERAAPLRGRVLGLDGAPVSGATASFATEDTALIVSDWTYERDGSSKQTGDEGQFEFPATLHPPVIIATHESGYAEVALELDQQPGDIRLKPWSRVEGRLMRSGEPIVGERIFLKPIRMLGGDNPHVQDSFGTTTDSHGGFVFDRVPPVPSTLYPYVSVWSETRLTSGAHVPLDLQPGESRIVRLGQDGIVVRGRVRPTGDLASQLDMNYCLNYLLKRAPGIAPPPPIARAGFDWRNGWTFDLIGSQEGKGFLSTLHHHFVKFASDGTFTIDGVAEGEYQFAISVYEPPEGCLIDPVGRDVVDFRVTAADAEKGNLDLGLIDVGVKLGPQVGDPFPNFRYEGLSKDETHSVAEWRGRYLLVDVWATWCAPCVAAIPELKAVADGLDSERAALLGVCLDEDLGKARVFIAARQMNWPQALLGERDNPLARQQLGIGSVPVYFVIDPQGTLIHRSFQLADAVAALHSALRFEIPVP